MAERQQVVACSLAAVAASWARALRGEAAGQPVAAYRMGAVAARAVRFAWARCVALAACSLVLCWARAFAAAGWASSSWAADKDYAYCPEAAAY